MAIRFWVIVVAIVSCGTSRLAAQTKDGPPDLQGVWTNGTLTPLTRPAEFADRYALTKAEAAEFERTAFERVMKTVPELDRMTAADLNDVYLDTATLKVVPDRRTSLIVDPPNGMLPPRAPAAQQRPVRPLSYDDPESRTLHERCLLSLNFGGSSSVPPLVPNPVLQDFYRIVQTPQHVMILSELVHDTRIIRIGGRHLPPDVRQWHGDSVGQWEGDTLVVDTTNFTDQTRYRGASTSLHVIERFRPIGAGTLDYRVTVEDPDTWTAPWTAQVPFSRTNNSMFEYACHEANYSMANSLRGMRAKEKDDEAAARKK
jgi:hypothetical protein